MCTSSHIFQASLKWFVPTREFHWLTRIINEKPLAETAILQLHQSAVDGCFRGTTSTQGGICLRVCGTYCVSQQAGEKATKFRCLNWISQTLGRSRSRADGHQWQISISTSAPRLSSMWLSWVPITILPVSVFHVHCIIIHRTLSLKILKNIGDRGH